MKSRVERSTFLCLLGNLHALCVVGATTVDKDRVGITVHNIQPPALGDLNRLGQKLSALRVPGSKFGSYPEGQSEMAHVSMSGGEFISGRLMAY